MRQKYAVVRIANKADELPLSYVAMSDKRISELEFDGNVLDDGQNILTIIYKGNKDICIHSSIACDIAAVDDKFNLMEYTIIEEEGSNGRLYTGTFNDLKGVKHIYALCLEEDKQTVKSFKVMRLCKNLDVEVFGCENNIAVEYLATLEGITRNL